jgi:hypothetical protein
MADGEGIMMDAFKIGGYSEKGREEFDRIFGKPKREFPCIAEEETKKTKGGYDGFQPSAS